jgi:alkylation response protein AidB-like acyl-CoA dehydrogenase
VRYVRERQQFGRPAGRYQAVWHRLADLATEIAACKSFVYGVAEQIDAGAEDQLSIMRFRAGYRIQ